MYHCVYPPDCRCSGGAHFPSPPKSWTPCMALFRSRRPLHRLRSRGCAHAADARWSSLLVAARRAARESHHHREGFKPFQYYNMSDLGGVRTGKLPFPFQDYKERFLVRVGTGRKYDFTMRRLMVWDLHLLLSGLGVKGRKRLCSNFYMRVLP